MTQPARLAAVAALLTLFAVSASLGQPSDVKPPSPVDAAAPQGAVEGSLADATLQADIERTVVRNAAQMVSGCDAERARQSIDIWPASVTQPPVAGGAWSEVWTLDLCDQSRRLRIDFTPTPAQGGTDFRIRMADEVAAETPPGAKR